MKEARIQKPERQQRLFGLQPRRQIESLLDVCRTSDATSEFLQRIDALRGSVVDRLAHGVLGAGLPRDPVEATHRLLNALEEGRGRQVGLGRADDRWFTFNAGMGWDADVVAAASRSITSCSARIRA